MGRKKEEEKEGKNASVKDQTKRKTVKGKGGGREYFGKKRWKRKEK